MTHLTAQEAGGASILAFLDTIAHSEIGDALLLSTDDGYNVLVGSTLYKPILFNDYTHHPKILNRQLNSTAAGRYQIIWPTWHDLVSLNGYTDFSPITQDRACIQLIKDRDAYDVVVSGDIELGIHLCREEWASLPGAGYGQHENRLNNLLAYYTTALTRYV